MPFPTICLFCDGPTWDGRNVCDGCHEYALTQIGTPPPIRKKPKDWSPSSSYRLRQVFRAASMTAKRLGPRTAHALQNRYFFVLDAVGAYIGRRLLACSRGLLSIHRNSRGKLVRLVTFSLCSKILDVSQFFFELRYLAFCCRERINQINRDQSCAQKGFQNGF